MIRMLLPLVLMLGLGIQAAQAEPRIRSAYDYVRHHGYVRFLKGPASPEAPRPVPRADPYQVGETKSFWSWDLSQMPPRDVQVPATCRALGANTYVFVADDQWGNAVDQAAVDAVAAALESATPAGSIHPEQGIVPNEIEGFGPVPDALDVDPKVFILLMELKSFNGQQFDGFFNAFNQYTDAETMAEAGYHSNELEMVTVNSAIRSVDTDMTLSIVAHEFQHLIHWGADVDELSWVDESMAEAAMTINGYYTDLAWLQDYLHTPSAPLYELATVHYGACLLFGSYLYERFGIQFLHSLVSDPAQGEAGFAASLAALNEVISMDELLLDWATATVGDSLGASDPRYSHAALEVGPPTQAGQIDSYPSQTPVQGSLSNTGTAYLRLANSGADVRVSLGSTPLDGLLARVILVEDDGQAWIGSLATGEVEIAFSQSGAGAAWVVLLARPDTSVQYTLEAELVDEPQHDGGDPDGDSPDGGADAGTDAGADEDPVCPSGQEAVIHNDELICVPICESDQILKPEGNSWVCAEEASGCGCAISKMRTSTLLLPLLGLLLGLGARRRR